MTNYRFVFAFVVATMLVVLAAAASLRTVIQIENASDARELTADLIARAVGLQGAFIDAENAQRGHLLTGDERFLPAYAAARDSIRVRLAELRSRTVSEAALQHMDAMGTMFTAMRENLPEVAGLRRREDMAAAMTLFAGGLDKTGMEAIRGELSGYVGLQQEALLRQRNAFDSSMSRMFGIIIATCVLALIYAILFAYLSYREAQHRIGGLVHLETRRLLATQEDVNQRLQRANTDLQISEERLAVTLDSIDDAVIATDAAGRVTLLNPLAERLTGWTRAQAADQPVEEVFHIIDAQTRRPATLPVKQTLTEGTTLSLSEHTVAVARDGSECDIADSCAPIRNRDGQVVGAVLVFRDVTESIRLDRALHEKNAELEHARQVADKANLAKSDFLSSMSHELRTPLSAILGFAQLMDSGSPPPTASQKRGIEQILKAGWYLLDLINEILDLALIESGRLSLSMEPVALAEVVRECQLMIEPQAQKRGIRLVFPQFDGPSFVTADRTRVKQVLVNLLSNAIKYNATGGSIVVECIATAAQRVRVSVTDSGAGIPPEKLAQLFQPFNRLGQEENAEEGSGIGLVVCKRLVELMGGVIGVESSIGKGSVFWIELNLSAEPQIELLAARSKGAAPAPRIAADAKLSTLLYVEDNPANLMLVEEIIARRPDIRLLTARDGIAGVKLAVASPPDVILMDINLPGISGIQAMQILAENPATAHIPVVALSANAMPRDIEKGLEAGFFRYLTKPIKVNEFMETLDVAFKFAQAQAAGPNREEAA